MTLVLTSAMTMASPWIRARAGLGWVVEKASSKKLRLLRCLARSGLDWVLVALRATSPGGGRSIGCMRLVPSVRGVVGWEPPFWLFRSANERFACVSRQVLPGVAAVGWLGAPENGRLIVAESAGRASQSGWFSLMVIAASKSKLVSVVFDQLPVSRAVIVLCQLEAISNWVAWGSSK